MIALLLVFALLFSGCNYAGRTQDAVISSVQKGDFVRAEESIDKAIQKKMPTGKFLSCREAVWMYLDRAMLHAWTGKLPAAIQDYNIALDAIDYYSQPTLQEQLTKTLLEDGQSAYVGPHYEHQLARLYLALALFQEGDLGNARALLLQAQNQAQLRIEEGKEAAGSTNLIAKYLLAAVLEKEGDLSNAEILYKEVAKERREPLAEHSQKKATVIVLSHTGLAPHKISTIAPVSVVSLAILEQLLAIYDIPPALSSLAGIPIPAFADSASGCSSTSIKFANAQSAHLQPWMDVSDAAHQTLEKELPKIAAHSAARLLIRRAFLGVVQKENQTAGIFADLALLGANLLTEADIRSWSTLPARIDLARLELEPGKHTLTFESRSHGAVQTKECQINLSPNELCIINLFTIHPHQMVIQIPKKNSEETL